MLSMDISQFTNLLRRHTGLIHKVAYAYCPNATDRDDVIQEIAIQLWRSRDRYDVRFKETTWIYRIAINVAISFHRRERRHSDRRVSLEGSAITIAVPSVEPSQDVELLMRCIDDLGELDKALVLLYLDGYDHASIADVLGITVSNVGTKLQRIKNKLHAAFERRLQPNETEKPHGTR
ncbi:MAG: sigma-70 family RNA polymerase sigma factor [Planctomycetales bacterium]|nr:sigma-70 family RNA polymerase sigma factor [Planctomycetales bacterium]